MPAPRRSARHFTLHVYGLVSRHRLQQQSHYKKVIIHSWHYENFALGCLWSQGCNNGHLWTSLTLKYRRTTILKPPPSVGQLQVVCHEYYASVNRHASTAVDIILLSSHKCLTGLCSNSAQIPIILHRTAFWDFSSQESTCCLHLYFGFVIQTAQNANEW